MFGGPFYRQAERPPRQAAADDLKGTDVNQRLVFRIHRVKMRWRVFSPEHLNDDAKKLTDCRHCFLDICTLSPMFF